MKSTRPLWLSLATIAIVATRSACAQDQSPAPPLKFERIVIDDDFPGAYQVEVADINGDKKPDVVAVGGGTCAWYENPTWKKRIITSPKETPGIISSASADIDGDGKAEVAIAYEFEMNQPKRGKLLLAVQDPANTDGWILKPVADIPSIHRVRWQRYKSSGTQYLIVAPIFGPESKPPTYDQDLATLLAFEVGKQPIDVETWTRIELDRRPVVHAIEATNQVHGPLNFITADNLGVALIRQGKTTAALSAGAPGAIPNRGASEVHIGAKRYVENRHEYLDSFIATIEPWHGNSVVIWPQLGHGPRTVIDDTLDAGHALWVADVDGDGTDEVFAGHRGKDHRVSVYKHDAKSNAWNRTVIDRDIAAQDLRGGDLDGDGTPDIVAVGGSTHNVVWYRPVGREASK